MSFILDIIIIAIVGITVYFSVKNGFVKTLMSSVSFLIALIIAFSFVGAVRGAISDTKFANGIRDTVETTIVDFVANKSEEAESDETPQFLTALETIGVDGDELNQKWTAWRASNTEVLKNELVDFVAEPATHAVLTVISFLILFLGAFLILKIVTYILDKFANLPVLNQINKLLGLALGIVIAILRVYVFCLIMRMLIPAGHALDIGIISSLKSSETLLFNFFHTHNIFWFIFG